MRAYRAAYAAFSMVTALLLGCAGGLKQRVDALEASQRSLRAQLNAADKRHQEAVERRLTSFEHAQTDFRLSWDAFKASYSPDLQKRLHSNLASTKQSMTHLRAWHNEAANVRAALQRDRQASHELVAAVRGHEREARAHNVVQQARAHIERAAAVAKEAREQAVQSLQATKSADARARRAEQAASGAMTAAKEAARSSRDVLDMSHRLGRIEGQLEAIDSGLQDEIERTSEGLAVLEQRLKEADGEIRQEHRQRLERLETELQELRRDIERVRARLRRRASRSWEQPHSPTSVYINPPAGISGPRTP